MNNISETVISLEEAKAALKCMRLSNLSEEEAIESLDSFIPRLRKVTTAALVEDIIENQLSESQKRCVKEYWYKGKNTAEIGRELNITQAAVYRTIQRANEAVKTLMTPLIRYQQDLSEAELTPLHTKELIKICAARNSDPNTLGEILKKLRTENALTPEALAKAMKITYRELTEAEDGRKPPALNIIAEYSAVFGVEITIKFKKGKGAYQCQKA